MTVDMYKYTQLLCAFGEISQKYVTARDLEELKEKYRDEIHSKRVLETIINIDILLKVLEKRGLLQYNDISVLKFIAQRYVNDKSIKVLITDYDQWLNENASKISNFYSCALVPKPDPVTVIPIEQQEPSMPHYELNVNVGILSENRFSINQTQFYTTTTTTTPIPSPVKQEKELQDLVVNKVSRQIGKFWTDVSRYLNIGEADIEEIEIKYFNAESSYEKMFKEALKLYFLENHPNWKIDLMRALDSSRRRDLKEMVEEIIYRYNNS